MIKQIIKSTICALLLLFAASCSNQPQNPNLVVYFSRAGHNYPDPNGKPLDKGHTAVLAEIIAEVANTDTFQIIPVAPYPENYKECVAIARHELDSNALPEYVGDIDIDNYTTIFIGYPIWHGEMPQIVKHFIERHNFNGKNVIPFCTHHGSGLGNSVDEMRKMLPNASVFSGFALWDTEADKQKSTQKVQEWIESISEN